MQLLYVLNNNAPVSPAINPLLFSVLGITDFPNRKAHYGAILPLLRVGWEWGQMRCTDKIPKVRSVHQAFEMVWFS